MACGSLESLAHANHNLNCETPALASLAMNADLRRLRVLSVAKYLVGNQELGSSNSVG